MPGISHYRINMNTNTVFFHTIIAGSGVQAYTIPTAPWKYVGRVVLFNNLLPGQTVYETIPLDHPSLFDDWVVAASYKTDPVRFCSIPSIFKFYVYRVTSSRYR